MNKQSLLYTVLFTFLVSFIFVLGLAAADQLTKERVADNRRIAQQRAVLNAFGIEAVSVNDVESNYRNVESTEVDGETLYRTVDNGVPLVAKEFSGSGLWGTINGIIGVTQDLTRTTGIEIISQNETPGLGARIGEEWFKAQFRGERIINGTIAVGDPGDGDPDHENGSVDAITGASRTSDAMRTILNTELADLAKLVGGLR